LKLLPILALTLLAGPVAAAPVHIALKSTALVAPGADGFFQLASVADLSGGDLAARVRLGSVSVGRAPLSGEVRRLTRGDLALKLRQAGCNPDKEAVLEGAGEVSVTMETSPPAPILGSQRGPSLITGGFSSIQAPQNWGGGAYLLRPGSPVTILIQSGALCISAPGVARQSGGVGDCIRVHRDGVMTDLNVIIVDAQTVRLEI